ncbi:MAG: hypothetical protein WC761_00100 [Candidatus Paceibacterota bacterium]|jgi:hypothetical protein
MEPWSITAEKLRNLWRGYWDCSDPAGRAAISVAIRAITRTIREQNAEIQKLYERSEESDRLLVAARKRPADWP